MTGAMYAGIAGLKTHMQDLNVIGNNIANVNTKGYKAGRSVFRSAIYTQLSGGRDGTSVVGSKNPAQIGYGANLTTVDIDMSTASYSPGRSTDLMIDGDGFFLLGDKETGNNVDPMDPSTLKSFTLTRVGDFEFGEDGYLKNGPGDVVYGFLVIGYVDGEPVYSDQLVPIRKPYQDEKGEILWPTLQYVNEDGDVVTDATGDDNEDTYLRLVDTSRVEDPNDPNATGTAQECVRAKLTSITIGNTGVISAKTSTGREIVIGAIALGTVDNPNGVTQLSGSTFTCGQGAGELAVNTIGGVGKDAYVKHTPGDLPAQGDDDDADAYTLPREHGTIDESGISFGMTYVNHSQHFATEDGDGEQTGIPYGSQTFDTGSSTLLVPGGLETSSTDLATEIANMITTQRGYQANTRVITVTDSMLEELVNMKR